MFTEYGLDFFDNRISRNCTGFSPTDNFFELFNQFIKVLIMGVFILVSFMIIIFFMFCIFMAFVVVMILVITFELVKDFFNLD